MDTAATLPRTPGEIVKAVFSFIGKSMLVLFGVLEIIGVIWDTFEQSISFLEISTLEMFFFVIFFFLVKRYVDAIGECKMPWRKALYRPLRNLGWFGLISTLPILFILIQQENFNFFFEYEKLLQLIDYTGVAICLYLAAPTENINNELENENDTPVGVNT
ncbi:MAG: hypothetical protein KAV87_62995 [Desulfobacteraceae bacterium]|nr:hypothetical protein [Desulfobacteraceae bacterium]